MKQLPTLTLASIPIVAIVLFYAMRSSPDKGVTKQVIVKNQIGANKASSTKIDFPEKKHFFISESAIIKIDEESARLAESVSDPKARQSMLKAKVKMIQKYCQPLFESWKLDQNKVNEILDVIQMREANLLRLSTESLKKGVAGARNRNSDILIESLTAESQLKSILGDSRYKQLAQIEDQIAREGKQRTQREMMNRRD